MQDGTQVRYRTGKIVYKAYLDREASDWRSKYTLVPVNGGRKRYRVDELDFRVFWSDDVAPVKTSLGKVQRPKSFNKFPEYSGCTRRTYLGKSWVFKLAKYAGDENRKNRIEAARYAMQTGMNSEAASAKYGKDAVDVVQRRYLEVPIAECHLLADGVLMMERVRPVVNLNFDEGAEQLTPAERHALGYRRPAWASKVDCEQIGYTSKGKLVAYDL